MVVVVVEAVVMKVEGVFLFELGALEARDKLSFRVLRQP